MPDPSTTCWTAVARAAEGDKAERDLFAQRYGPVVRAFLDARWRQAHRQGDVEDALQEVFLECFKEGGALETVAPGRPGGFRAFLFGVTRKVASRYDERFVRRRREVAMEEIPSAAEVVVEDPAQAFDRAWAQAMVRDAVRLQARQARSAGAGAEERVEVLRLRFQEGLPIREIARIQGRDAARVHYDYARARQEFRLALRETVAFHMPGGEAGLEQECTRLLELLRS